MAYKLSMRHQQDDISRRTNQPSPISLKHYAILCAAISCLSLITAFAFSFNAREIEQGKLQKIGEVSDIITVLKEGNFTSKPFSTTKNNTVITIDMKLDMKKVGWATVNGTLQNHDQKDLISFSHEFWYEEGYDADGAWSEASDTESFTLTLPKPGTYSISLEFEANSPTSVNSVHISLSEQYGSHIPHMVFGIILAIIAAALIGYENTHASAHYRKRLS